MEPLAIIDNGQESKHKWIQSADGSMLSYRVSIKKIKEEELTQDQLNTLRKCWSESFINLDLAKLYTAGIPWAAFTLPFLLKGTLSM